MAAGSMRVRISPILRILLLGSWLVAGCGQPSGPAPSTFRLPYSVSESDRAISDLLGGLISALETGGGLDSPYPVSGQVMSSPDPANPNGSLESCVQAFAPTDGAKPCIALNPAGDFIRIQAIVWQTEAFFMYRFYFQPARPGPLDMTRNFVAIDLFLIHDPAMLSNVVEAIQSTADDLGARPFTP